VLLPVRRSMVRPERFSDGTNWTTSLSVTTRTASLSTSGIREPGVWACAVREVPASVATRADTKPAPLVQSNPRLDIDEVLELQLHLANNMPNPPAFFTRWKIAEVPKSGESGPAFAIAYRVGSNFRNGSKPGLTTPKSGFRFTPESGLCANITPCPFRAKSRLMHRSS
jgi:hypothetical protein